MAEDEPLPCNFTGFSLGRDKNGDVLIEQNIYLRKLEVLQTDATFKQFRSMRMTLASLSHTRPDRLFEISQLAQVTEAMFPERGLIRMLRIDVKDGYNKSLSLIVPRIDKSEFAYCFF